MVKAPLGIPLPTLGHRRSRESSILIGIEGMRRWRDLVSPQRSHKEKHSCNKGGNAMLRRQKGGVIKAFLQFAIHESRRKWGRHISLTKLISINRLTIIVGKERKASNRQRVAKSNPQVPSSDTQGAHKIQS